MEGVTVECHSGFDVGATEAKALGTVSTSSMLRLKENTGWAAGQRKEREPHLAVAVTTDRRGLEGGERRAKECQGHCQHGRSRHADRDRPAHLRGLR